MRHASRRMIRPISLVVFCCLVLLVAASGSVVAQSTADITVATDDSGDYTSIQNAVDNASDGDQIRVDQGTYEQHTEIGKNITLFAPNGATIANTSTAAAEYNSIQLRSGFQIFGDVHPTISGFTLTDWRWAISAGGSEGDWTVENTEISGGDCGVCAAGTLGDWTVSNTTLTNAGTISGYESTGHWSIENTTVKQTDISAEKSTGQITIERTSFKDVDSDAISIEESTGSLAIIDTTIQNITYAAVEAENTSADITISTTDISASDTGIDLEKGSTGDLTVEKMSMSDVTYDAIDVQNSSGAITVQDTTIQTASNGIDAEKSNGQLTVTNLTVKDTDGDGIDASNATGDATVHASAFRSIGDKSIDVIDSEGKWNIHESILTGGSEGTVDAWDAAITVNASYNYWDAADGPSGQFNGSGGEAGGNIMVTPYYTDSSLTTLASETGTNGDNGGSATGDPFTEPLSGVQGNNPPADTDGDGLYDDVNGDGQATFDDAVALAFADTSTLSQAQSNALDFDGDGNVDFNDAVELAFL